MPYGPRRKGLKCPVQGCEKRFNGPEMTGLASHYRAAHEGPGEPRYEQFRDWFFKERQLRPAALMAKLRS